MDCKEFNGKITPKSIQRASCSYQSVENILSTFDESTDIHRPSGRHENINTKADVISLAEQFKDMIYLNTNLEEHMDPT